MTTYPALEISFEFRNQRFQSAAKGLIAFSNAMTLSWKDIAPIALRKELESFLKSVTEALAKRHGNPWPTGTTATSLSRRSGDLISSIRNSVHVYGTTLQDMYGVVGSVFYGRTHEFGATIRPVKAQFLTVPLPAALNSDGTPKKKGARDWDNTFVFRSRKGSLIIAQKHGTDIIPLYVLVKEVTIPPRLKMGETLRAGVPYFVDKAMEAMLNEVRKGLGKI